MNKNKILIVFFLAYLTRGVLSSLSKIKLKGKWFVDQDDRVVVLHGINAVEKKFPWVPDYGYINLKNKTQLTYLKNWGFNVVRLGFMWSGLYPQKGQINLTYVEEMKGIIETLDSFGIYVIIDLHQDMMSSKFNSYDGVPLWVLNEIPNPKHAYPWPFKSQNIGFGAYATEACGFAFECLYKNINNFRDYFIQYWVTIAQIFSNTSSILAYELINEPWAGDIYQNPFYMLPGNAGKYNLMPLYDAVYAEIRKYDQKTIVFYEPVTWGVMSTKKGFGTGFDNAPGNDLTSTALSWHFYCWLLDIDTNPIKNDTYPVFVHKVCDNWQLNLYFKTVKDDMIKIGGGASFLTEFGVCAFQDPITGNLNTNECEYILDGADSNIESWTYWDSNFYDDNFQINYNFVNILSRIYPMSTNGIPIELYYNSTNKFFSYKFQMNISTLEDALKPTEIFIPLDLFKKGFDVQISEFLSWYFAKESSRILVTLNNNLVNYFLAEKDFIFQSDSIVQIKAKL